MRSLIVLTAGFIAFGFIAATTPQTGKATCNVTEAKLKCKKELVPYRYTNMAVQRIFYRRYNQRKEISFPLMFDTRHRFVFNTESLPQDIIIKIYSESSFAKKRDELASFNSSDGQFTYEPEIELGIPAIYIDFLVPASISEDTKTIQKGCVVIMIGYEDEYAAFEGESTQGTE